VKIRESDLDGNGAPGGVLAGQPARQVFQDFCECSDQLFYLGRLQIADSAQAQTD
jgi:hypothetical protein